MKFSNRITAYSYPIGLRLGTMILDICLRNPYEQEFFLREEEESEFQKFSRMSFVHLSRRRRNLDLFDLKDDRSVRSALFSHFLASSSLVLGQH